jgi:hypothetical protein
MVSMGIIMGTTGGEKADTDSIPTSPHLSSELPLPQMNLPANTPVNKRENKGRAYFS